jgi:hypothetical protein
MKWYVRTAVYDNGNVKVLAAGSTMKIENSYCLEDDRFDIYVDVFDTEQELKDWLKEHERELTYV